MFANHFALNSLVINRRYFSPDCWEKWGPYEEFCEPCQGNYKIRTRKPKSPHYPCPGKDKDWKSCDTKNKCCFTPWTRSSECPQTCFVELQNYTREARDPPEDASEEKLAHWPYDKFCTGDRFEQRPCGPIRPVGRYFVTTKCTITGQYLSI